MAFMYMVNRYNNSSDPMIDVVWIFIEVNYGLARKNSPSMYYYTLPSEIFIIALQVGLL